MGPITLGMQALNRTSGTQSPTLVSKASDTQSGSAPAKASALQTPLGPTDSGSRKAARSSTNLGAMMSSGLKIGAAVMGVIIGASALTGCASTSGTYQGPSYAEIHRATLTWESPTGNTDGTSFHDENGDGRIDGVRGFIVYRGDSPRAANGAYADSRELTNPDCKSRGGRTLCTYAWNGLPSGTHYFSVKAYKEITPGNRSISDFSNEASKTIP